MEKYHLNKFLKEVKSRSDFGSCKDEIRPWYNPVGDYIEFQATNEEFIADRIDDYLTIYKSIDNNQPTGFKIKDVQALIRKVGAEGL